MHLSKPLPSDYSSELIRTSECNDKSLLACIDALVLQAWRDHEPVVADWLAQQPATADIEDAYVWVVRCGKVLAATGRLTIHATVSELPRAYFFEGLEQYLPGPIASINRLSVVKPHNGQGIATFLDRERTIKAKELGAQSIVGICQLHRADALQRHCGYSTICEPRSGKAIPEVKWCVSARLANVGL